MFDLFGVRCIRQRQPTGSALSAGGPRRHQHHRCAPARTLHQTTVTAADNETPMLYQHLGVADVLRLCTDID